ncbi:MAG: hypothetical protein H0U73_01875 [Tatlockia sp.]|nr:hypothetical protein [Tatlockia sp.]
MYSKYYEDLNNLIIKAKSVYELSRDVVVPVACGMLMQRAICNDTPPSESIVELQRELGVLNERCRLQEGINLLNEEFIQLVKQGNSKKNPEIKLIEAQIENYQQELSNLILSDYRDCSSTNVNDLQGSLNSQTIHLKDLLEIANDQSQYYLHLVESSEKLIYKNQVEIGMFKPEKSFPKSIKDPKVTTPESFFGVGR